MPSSLGNVVVSFGADLGDFDKGLGKLESRLKKLGRQLGEAGRSLTIGLTAPIAGLGFAAVKSSGLLSQLFSTLRESSSAVLAQLGADIVEALDLRGLIGRAIEAVDSFGEALERMPRGLKSFLIISLSLAAAIGPLLLGLSGIVKVLGAVVIGGKILLGILALLAASPVALAVLGIGAALTAAAIAFSRASSGARDLRREITSLAQAETEVASLRRGLEGIADLSDLEGSISRLVDLRARLEAVGAATGRIDELIEQFTRLRDLLPVLEELRTEELERKLKRIQGEVREAGLQSILFSQSQDRLQISIDANVAEMAALEAAIRRVTEESGRPLSGMLSDPLLQGLLSRYRELQLATRNLTAEQERLNEVERQARVEETNRRLALQSQKVSELNFKYQLLSVSITSGFQAIAVAAANVAAGSETLGDAVLGALQSIVNALIGVIATMIAVTVIAIVEHGAMSGGFLAALIAVGLAAIVVSAALGAARAHSQRARSEAKGFARGGLVTGPTLAMIGEGGEDEIVAPLSRIPDLLGIGGFSQRIELSIDGRTLGSAVARGLPRHLRVLGISG